MIIINFEKVNQSLKQCIYQVINMELSEPLNQLQDRRNLDYYKQDNNYIFSVRSEETNGKHSKSMYGKIIGPISFDPVFSETAFLSFKYYLNTDYTRNLEYDSKRNLFDELPPLEQVGIK